MQRNFQALAVALGVGSALLVTAPDDARAQCSIGDYRGTCTSDIGYAGCCPTANSIQWCEPGDIDLGRSFRVGNKPMVDVGGLHKSSFSAMTVDEEGMRIPSNVPQAVLDALVTPNGGENVQTSTFYRIAPSHPAVLARDGDPAKTTLLAGT